jgi:hypothetical protein
MGSGRMAIRVAIRPLDPAAHVVAALFSIIEVQTLPNELAEVFAFSLHSVCERLSLRVEADARYVAHSKSPRRLWVTPFIMVGHCSPSTVLILL